MPLTLVQASCRARTNGGDPICFGYNLGTCSLQVKRGRCEKGFHVCAVPKCGKHHPFAQCPTKKEAGSWLEREVEVDHTVEDGNDPREDLSVGPPKKRPHVQKFAHEDACNDSFSDFDVPSEPLGATSKDANRPPSLPSRVPGGTHLFIEACCGCALLSSCVAKLGFEVMPIDFEGYKHRPFVHVIQLDLRKPETWELLRYVAESRRPFHVHFAPPCGTASRARDFPMSMEDHGPPPLRSEQWPLGFPGLVGVSAAKVNSANQIYLQVCSFCEFLNTLNITWSIENPERSYLWYIGVYKRLAKNAIFVCFDSVFHGGEKKKATGLLTSLQVLEALAGRCTGDHEHLEWGHTRTKDGIVFDTSKEAAYPKMLCERFATLLAMHASSLDMVLNPEMSEKDDPRVATYKQPRGRKVPAVVAEFESTKTIRTRFEDCPKLDDKNKLTSSFYGIPIGSKLLRRAPVSKGQTTEKNMLWVFGIFRDAGSFLKLARSVQHPFDSFRALPVETLRVLCNILSRHPLQTMKKRLENFRHGGMLLSNSRRRMTRSLLAWMQGVQQSLRARTWHCWSRFQKRSIVEVRNEIR